MDELGENKAMRVKRGGGVCSISVKGENIQEVKFMWYLGAILMRRPQVRLKLRVEFGTEERSC